MARTAQLGTRIRMPYKPNEIAATRVEGAGSPLKPEVVRQITQGMTSTIIQTFNTHVSDDNKRGINPRLELWALPEHLRFELTVELIEPNDALVWYNDKFDAHGFHENVHEAVVVAVDHWSRSDFGFHLIANSTKIEART